MRFTTADPAIQWLINHHQNYHPTLPRMNGIQREIRIKNQKLTSGTVELAFNGIENDGSTSCQSFQPMQNRNGIYSKKIRHTPGLTISNLSEMQSAFVIDKRFQLMMECQTNALQLKGLRQPRGGIILTWLEMST
jgi:hypothetical protein